MARLPSRNSHAAHSPSATAMDTHKHCRFPAQILKDPYAHAVAVQQRLRSRRRDALAPDFDVRETESAFYLEGELPGIADRSAIRLDWIDRRTLAIDAKIEKVDLEAEWGLLRPIRSPTFQPLEPRRSSQQSSGTASEGEEMALDEDKPSKPVIREWLSERRTGHYQRTFTFPTDVDASAIRARLGQGLLRVLVPKVVRSGVESKQVDIESCE